MKYPKVGDKFHWKDCNGEIFESYCKKVDKDPNGQIMTNYFIYLTPNGGGNFVVEEDILDPESKEVIEFKKKLCRKIKDPKQYKDTKQYKIAVC